MNNTLLDSQTRDDTAASEDQVAPTQARGVLLTLDVTKAPLTKEQAEAAVAAAEESEDEEALAEAEAALEVAEEAEAGTLAVSIEGRDPASGKYVTLTAFAATKEAKELGEGTTLAFTLYPGAAETTALAGHEVMGLALPGRWRAVVTHSKPGAWEYSLGATMLR